MRRLAALLVLAASAALALPTAAPAAVGDLTLLAQPDSCLTDTGASANSAFVCGTLPLSPYSSNASLIGTAGAVAPDGRTVYLGGDGRLDVLTRDPATGALTRTDCWDDGTSGAHGADCDTTTHPFAPEEITAFGDDVYINNSGILQHFRRQADGTLALQADCLYRYGDTAFAGCDAARGLGGRATAVSPDGKQLFIGSTNVMYALDRDPATGALSQSSTPVCATYNGVDPFTSAGGACVDTRGIGANHAEIEFSPDGKQLYVAAQDGLAVFQRDPATGEITQPAGADGCISTTSTEGCAVSSLVDGVTDVSVASDGKNVYAAAHPGGGYALVGFTRDATTGLLSVLPTNGGCVSTGGRSQCSNYPARVAVAPDGKQVYTLHSSGALVQAWDRADDGTLTARLGAKGCFTVAAPSGADDCAQHDLALGTNGLFDISADGASLYAGGGGYTGHYGYQLLTLAREAPPVPDVASPSIEISTPPLGKATYGQGEHVVASYSCTDDRPGVSCDGPVASGAPIDTSRTGTNIPFKVVAVDGAGHRSETTHFYDVVPAAQRPAPDTTAPRITVAAPPPGYVYEPGGAASAAFYPGQVALLSYSCSDDVAVAACGGTVASGGRIDTSRAGRGQALRITATDTAGNTTVRELRYDVAAPVGKPLPAEIKQQAQPALHAASSAPGTVSAGALAKGGQSVNLGRVAANTDAAAGYAGVARNGGSLIGQASGNLIGQASGNLIGAAASNLIGAAASNLIGAAASNLVANTQAMVVSSGGANVVSAGGLNRAHVVARAAAAAKPKLVRLASARRHYAKAGRAALRLKLSAAGRKALRKVFARKGRQTVKVVFAVATHATGSTLPPVIVVRTVKIRE